MLFLTKIRPITVKLCEVRIAMDGSSLWKKKSKHFRIIKSGK